MSLQIKPILTPTGAYLYVLLSSLLLLEGPISGVAYLLVGKKVPKLALRGPERMTLKEDGR